MSMKLSSRQRDIVATVMEDTGTPGVAVALVQDGRIVAEEGMGYRNLAQRLPMTAQTVSPICSLTKSFTSVAIMQLVEDGVLWLDEPVVSYLPEFHVADRAASQKITPRMLLCHKSGMGRTGLQQVMFNEDSPPPYRDRLDLMTQLGDVELQTAPNASWSYCNEGFVTLSVLLETLTGTSLEDHIERRIFNAVGMPDSFTRFRQWRAAPDRVTNYVKTSDGFSQGYLPEEYGIYLASGGICSTANDLANYAINTMDYENSPLLSAGSLDQMHAISNPYGDTGWGYGFGWEIAWDGSRKVVHHGGDLAGINTHLLTVPSERLAVVVLTNMSGGNPRRIAEDLAGDMLGKPLFRPSPQEPLPVRTRFPAPPESSLAAIAGTYAMDDGDGGIIELELNETQLQVTFRDPSAESGPETSRAVAIGEGLFMTLSNGDLLHVQFDQMGAVTGVLSGGNRYNRIDDAQA
jgi:CubicO group peptidase (beta-lactamase class C family)